LPILMILHVLVEQSLLERAQATSGDVPISFSEL